MFIIPENYYSLILIFSLSLSLPPPFLPLPSLSLTQMITFRSQFSTYCGSQRLNSVTQLVGLCVKCFYPLSCFALPHKYISDRKIRCGKIITYDQVAEEAA